MDKELINENEPLQGMCGDVNIFLSETDETEDGKVEIIGEIEIMIAEEKSRKKGIAKEALLMMIGYGKKNFTN
jgi:hypothetical protein